MILILLHVFINGLQDRMECTLSKLLDNIKLGAEADNAGGQDCSSVGPCEAGEMG